MVCFETNKLEDNMDSTVSLMDIFKTLKKRWKFIVLLTLAAALIGGAVSYLVLKPVYQVSTQILVNQKNADKQLDLTQLQSNVNLINTYSDIMKSPVILEKVINKLNLTQSFEELNKDISITNQTNSQVFTLNVENENASLATQIANTLSETFQQEIKGIMNVDNVSILAKAELKKIPAPVKPKPLLNILVAIALGLISGLGTALLLEFWDNTIKDDQDVADLGLPVLGSVQKMSMVHKKVKGRSIKPAMGSETVVSSGEK